MTDFTVVNPVSDVTVTSRGSVQVRQQVRMDDGSLQFFRYVLQPGADLTGQHPDIAAKATAAWTPEVVAAWQAAAAAARSLR